MGQFPPVGTLSDFTKKNKNIYTDPVLYLDELFIQLVVVVNLKK